MNRIKKFLKEEKKDVPMQNTSPIAEKMRKLASKYLNEMPSDVDPADAEAWESGYDKIKDLVHSADQKLSAAMKDIPFSEETLKQGTLSIFWLTTQMMKESLTLVQQSEVIEAVSQARKYMPANESWRVVQFVWASFLEHKRKQE